MTRRRDLVEGGPVAMVRLSSAEAGILARVFKRQFRGEAVQSFTQDGMQRIFNASRDLQLRSNDEPSRQVRENLRYEAHTLHFLGHRIYETFRSHRLAAWDEDDRPDREGGE